MNLDRKLQKEILDHLKTLYPRFMMRLNETVFAKHPDFLANIVYLAEHELVELKSHPSSTGSGEIHVLGAKITHRGLDHLEQDGGISAILRTTPVKIVNPQDFLVHDFLSLLEKTLTASELPEEEKKTWLERVKVFSAPVAQKILSEVLLRLPALWK